MLLRLEIIFIFAIFMTTGCQTVSISHLSRLKCTPFPSGPSVLKTAEHSYDRSLDRFFAISVLRNRRQVVDLAKSIVIPKEVDDLVRFNQIGPSDKVIGIGRYKNLDVVGIHVLDRDHRSRIEVWDLNRKRVIAKTSQYVNLLDAELKIVFQPKNIWFFVGGSEKFDPAARPWQVMKGSDRGGVLRFRKFRHIRGKLRLLFDESGSYAIWSYRNPLSLYTKTEISIARLSDRFAKHRLEMPKLAHPDEWSGKIYRGRIYLGFVTGDSISGTSQVHFSEYSFSGNHLATRSLNLEDQELLDLKPVVLGKKKLLIAVLYSGGKIYIARYRILKRKMILDSRIGPFESSIGISGVAVRNNTVYLNLLKKEGYFHKPYICQPNI